MRPGHMLPAMVVLTLAVVARAAETPVAIEDHRYRPATVHVRVGDKVVWTNNGDSDHTVTADDGSFASGTLKSGQSFTHTFSRKGTYAYRCDLHPRMKGKVIVE